MAEDQDFTGFQVLRLHYSADPEKFTPEHIKKLKADTPSEDWEREFELKPVGHMGNYPVYGDYKKSLHESSSLQYNPVLKDVIRGWDFGKVHPVVVFIQVDGLKKDVIGEVYGTQIYLPQFCQQVLEYSQKNFPGAKFTDWVDATGKNERDNGLSSVAVLRQYGIKPKWRMQDIEEGVDLIKHELIRIVEGRPQLMFNPVKAPRLCDAMRGGYQRDKKGKVIKDGTHDHAPDAFRYAMSGILTGVARDKADYYNKLKNYKYKPMNPFTGR